MRRLMLWIVGLSLVLLIGGVLAQMMIQDPGVLMLTWNGWIVETTFWTGMALMLSTVVTVIVVLLLIRRFAPTRLWQALRERRSQKVAKKETAIAIDSWLFGREDRALQALQLVAAAGGSDRLPHAVSLAVGLQHADWLQRMAQFIQQEPELKLFAQALQAERAWQAGRKDEFLQLVRAHPALGQVSWLRERAWQAQLEQGHAAELVLEINEAAHINPQQRQAWLARAVGAALAQNHGKPGMANAVLKVLSKTQRQQPEIVGAEIAYLVSVGEHDQAFKRLKALLHSPEQREQCALLLTIQVEGTRKLDLLEGLSSANPGPAFCHTAGTVNLQQQLWGQAQHWLELGWQQNDRRCGMQLAHLFEQRNMPEQAARLYRELAIRSVPA